MIRLSAKSISALLTVALLFGLGGCVNTATETAVSNSADSPPQQATEDAEEEWDYDQILIDGAKGAWPGYPRLVSGKSIDWRVAKNMGSPEQVVAIGPAMYLPYVPSQPDLDFYLLHPTGVSGNCVMIYTFEEMMNFVGKYLGAYSCWEDVYIGDEEPAIE